MQELRGSLTNAAALCFARGWQGGTVFQLAEELKVSTDDILEADYEKMGELCRRAQAKYWAEHKGDINALMFKHLGVLLEALKCDYDSHDYPPWLVRADGVYRILSESY